MQIRSFQLSDYRSVVELLEEVLSEECFEETLGAFARQLSWDGDLILVATINDTIAGVMIGTIDHHKGYVYRVAVRTEFQRRGVGKSLMSAMKTRFRQRKVLKILIAADKHNQELLPFYEAIGARPVDFVNPSRPLAIVAG